MAQRHFSAAELHRRYDGAMSAFARTLADAALRVQFRQDVDGFMRACAAGVWSVGEGVGPASSRRSTASTARGTRLPAASTGKWSP